jgi:hypothetical protein
MLLPTQNCLLLTSCLPLPAPPCLLCPLPLPALAPAPACPDPVPLSQGVFHVEGKYTSRGPRLIEVNCRMVSGVGAAGSAPPSPPVRLPACLPARGFPKPHPFAHLAIYLLAQRPSHHPLAPSLPPLFSCRVAAPCAP